MKVAVTLISSAFVLVILASTLARAVTAPEPLFLASLDMTPSAIQSDLSVVYDYDIVYVRTPRAGDTVRSYWTEIAHPAVLDAGADLMLLHPNGSEELLVTGGEGAVTDPFVAFDGEWVYYSYFPSVAGATQFNNNLPLGADIYKIHVPTRRVVRLTDEDRFTLVRWIDLGCPIDLDRNSNRGYGWMADDNRPVIALTYPKAGVNVSVTRILLGMYDYYSGLDMDSFSVTANFVLDGIPAGQSLASRFILKAPGIWELKLNQSVVQQRGRIVVSIKDLQGNVTKIDRVFSVGE